MEQSKDSQDMDVTPINRAMTWPEYLAEESELRRLSAIEAERDALRAEVERLRAAPAPVAQPADPMTLLTDADVIDAAQGWREFDAPEGASPLGRMVYGGCRAAMNAYRDALTRAAPAPVAPAEFEIRDDGERVRVDRWEVGIRRIVALLWGNRHAFEVDEVVEAVRALVPTPNDDDEALVRGVLDAPAPVAQPLTWYEGAPPFPQDQEWFIAETIYGDRVVLRSLDEGRVHKHTYDFKTADETYMAKEIIKRWMQFPDCEYLPPAAPVPVAQPLVESVINAARAAMDESTKAYDADMSIKIPSHLAASLSLCLDEYDRAHGIVQGGAA